MRGAGTRERKAVLRRALDVCVVDGLWYDGHGTQVEEDYALVVESNPGHNNRERGRKRTFTTSAAVASTGVRPLSLLIALEGCVGSCGESRDCDAAMGCGKPILFTLFAVQFSRRRS